MLDSNTLFHFMKVNPLILVLESHVYLLSFCRSLSALLALPKTHSRVLFPSALLMWKLMASLRAVPQTDLCTTLPSEFQFFFRLLKYHGPNSYYSESCPLCKFHIKTSPSIHSFLDRLSLRRERATFDALLLQLENTCTSSVSVAKLLNKSVHGWR